MSDPRIIKKYPNRRLYDTVESRYITLADVRKLVVERIEFMVVDKKTQQDITRTILLQVIAEQENGVGPVMSRDFLAQIIRSYGGATQGVLGSYLEQSLKLFAAQQRDLRDRVRNVVEIDPVDTIAGVAQRNYQRWRLVQDEILRTLMNANAAGGRVSGEDKAPDSPILADDEQRSSNVA
ncbi:MAG: polyhydroxyalkanoate synthesis repressor PhaR [Steroidobacteraceae bacterium]|nr:polyhydroxyalkanoate synthesis repressor PhaR [Steroidobacteraceae bacterium]